MKKNLINILAVLLFITAAYFKFENIRMKQRLINIEFEKLKPVHDSIYSKTNNLILSLDIIEAKKQELQILETELLKDEYKEGMTLEEALQILGAR